MRRPIPHSVLRGLAAIIAIATSLLLITGVIGEDFLAPDLVLITVLLFGALLGESAVTRALLLAGFAATSGVFGVSVWQSFVDDEPNWRTFAGVVVCLGVVVSLVAERGSADESQSGRRRA